MDTMDNLIGIVYQPEQYSRKHDSLILSAMREAGIMLYPHHYGLLGSPNAFSFPDDGRPVPDIVGVMGSIRYLRDASKWMSNQTSWTTLFSSELHYCHRYLHMLPSSDLLNGDAVMLSFGMLKQRGLLAMQQYWQLPESAGLFIRPDQSLKVCEAEVVTTSSWADWLHYREKHSGLQDTSLLWVSPERSFDLECRCLISNHEVTSVSSYDGLGQKEPVSMDAEQSIRDFVTPLLERIEIDDLSYILDVARTPSGWKVVELNCLSTSGLYALNPRAVAIAWKNALSFDLLMRTSI